MSYKHILAVAACCTMLSGCGTHTAAPDAVKTEPTALPSTVTDTKPTLTTTAEPSTTATSSATEATTTTTQTAPTVPAVAVSDATFVNVRDYIPDIAVELKYATADNFTGQVIYEFSDAYLRYGTVKKLQAVQEMLKDHGVGLKIWDGFRPVSAQFSLWEAYPDPAFVADPRNGYSSHSRGNTVDVTLIDSEGNDVVMPTAFDDFSSLANRNYSDCSEEAAANAMLLESTMTSCGFTPYYAEWWHFSDERYYEVETEFDPS